MSSIHVVIPFTPVMTKSISLANNAGDPCKPIRVILHWYLAPLPDMEKAVYCLLFSYNDCCQKSEVKLQVLNMAELALQTSSKHSLTSLTHYLSGRLLRLTALKS
jgi:hypothetical protein